MCDFCFVLFCCVALLRFFPVQPVSFCHLKAVPGLGFRVSPQVCLKGQVMIWPTGGARQNLKLPCPISSLVGRGGEGLWGHEADSDGNHGGSPRVFQIGNPGPANSSPPAPSMVTWSLPGSCSTASRLESARSDLQTSPSSSQQAAFYGRPYVLNSETESLPQESTRSPMTTSVA